MERAQPDHQLVATHLVERAALYRRAPFALYGLAGAFEGPRALGESATSEDDGNETVEYLGLSHGSHNDDGQAHIDVITATPAGAPDLLDLLAAVAGVVLPPPARAAETTEALAGTLGPVRPLTRSVDLDGQAFEATGFEAGQSWILTAAVGDLTVTIAASNYPSDGGLALTRVTNLDDYIAGTRQLLGQ